MREEAGDEPSLPSGIWPNSSLLSVKVTIRCQLEALECPHNTELGLFCSEHSVVATQAKGEAVRGEMNKEQSCFLETGGACAESTELAGVAQPRGDELAIPAWPSAHTAALLGTDSRAPPLPPCG